MGSTLTEVPSLATDIRERWFHPDGHQITKAEIGLLLHRASLDPDGEASTENKRHVKHIIKNLTDPPKVASYSTIRGWITAARKATVKYGDKVEEKFGIQRTAGAPSLTSKERLMAYTQSETRLQKSGRT